MLRPVGERKAGTALTESADNSVMGNPAKRDDRLDPRHAGDGSGEELPAIGDLLRQRLVFRRDAAHGVGDGGVDQRKAVVRAGGMSPKKSE